MYQDRMSFARLTATSNRQLSSKRDERERERTLQKKIGDLQAQTQKLERRIMLLKTENETLKKRQDDQKPLEEKIKSLKKRNAELATIARRLEEKAKALQQENAKNKAKTKEEGGADSEHIKRLFARQRAKDLAEHAKNMLAKDREIEDLRKKCQELADHLSNGDVNAPENVQLYEEKEELVNIVKQAAKERLQLEQQLAHIKSKERPGASADEKEREKARAELEAANEILHKEIEKLEQALQQTDSVKEELSEKTQECSKLKKDIGQLKEVKSELEEELQSTSAKNAQLAVQISELEDQVKELARVNEECSTLRVTLATAQHERESAKEQVSTLQTRVNSLENLVRDLQESAEQLHSLEHDYKDALSQLSTKQQLIHQLQEVQEGSRAEHEKAVTDLQKKVKELDSKCQAQEKRQDDLNAEVQTLRQQKAEQQALLLQQQEEQKRQLQLLQEQQQQQQQQQQEREAKNRQRNSPLAVIKHSAGKPDAEARVPSTHHEDVIQSTAVRVTEVNPLDTSAVPDSSKSHDTEPDDSGMDSRKDTRPHSGLALLNDSRLSALAMRGPIQVYVAKYSYNPFEYSPNENPEAELQLNAGDYVLVLGDMDEDGFFEGELIEGRRGLVPSNFIERVAEEDLVEFHAALALAGGVEDSNNKLGHSPMDSDPEEVPTTNFEVVNGQHSKNILNNNNNNTYEPPHPQHLALERQLTTSVLISWQHPEGLDPASVQAYHVYLDGALKMTVKATERTKALLEDVDANQNHRVSVRSLSNQGQSKDAQCTMLIGRDVLPVPSDLGVRSVTHNSATVTWLPGNSNCSHAILLNGREVKVIMPGLFHYTITGLVPETVYRVTIATKPAAGTYGERHKFSQDKVSGNIEFKTPPAGGGAPEPPLNVQVESGPREGTLLLTWLPVTINSSGFSNGAVVTGYAIYADGNKIKEAKGPTNDHLILTSEDFRGYVPKQMSVRTVTVDRQESTDSLPVRLPHALVKELSVGAAKAMASEAVSQRKSPNVGAQGEHAGHDTDEEIEAAFQEAENSSPEIEAQIAEPFEESSSSELSDIPEVEEEMGADDPSQNGERSLAISHSQADKLRKSPKPSPRKVSPSGGRADTEPDFSPKQFHGQKPDPSRNDGLLTTPMIVPAIEITRDSSTERGTSFEEDPELAGTRKPTTPHDPAAKLKHRQASIEDGVEKPLPSQDPITQRYRSGTDEPSAFRSVEQGKQRAQSDTHSPDSAKVREDSLGRRPGSSGSSKNSTSHSAKEERHRDDRHRDRNEKHREEKHRDEKYRDEIHKDETLKHRDEVHRDDRHRDDRHRDDRHRDEKHREDRHRDDRHPPNHEDSVPPPKPTRVTPSDSARLTPADIEETNDRDSISGEINPVVDDSMVRLFIALFDYDPMTMSPNVDAVDEELPFREGQILKVYGDKDADGFYRGEASGQLGYIPCNMVSEIHIDDPDLVEQLLKESQTNSTHHPGLTDNKSDKMGDHLTPNGLPPMPPSGPLRRMVALYDYDPQELSPNVDAEVELPFKQGDIVYVMGDMDEDGFFTGEVQGMRGLVPSNFLQDAPLSDEDEILESASMVSPSRSQGSISAASRRSDSANTLNNVSRKDRLSLSPPTERAIVLDTPPSTQNPPANKEQASDDDKRAKKKGGLFNKGRNILKKFAR